MKLAILLNNPEEEAATISKALRDTGIEVECEAGKVLLETEKLVSDTFDLEDHASIRRIWNRVHELIAIMNGASRVEPGTLNEISLAHLMYMSNDGQRRRMPNTGWLDAVLPSIRLTPPDPASFITFALTDVTAAKALRLFSGELDWVNLYRIYEVIEEAARPGIIESGWATILEIKTFKRCANNASITGDASRQGTSDAAPTPLAMSQAEAVHLIGRILREWLNSKVMGR